ncbi:ribonuclease HII [Desulfobotulus sp. H1]|uniref:Ribonuclease HII n=1 Tax=Desulfobotulus pelophilus TaxID=2823377 RepID=A0ABT3NAP5_9BACT|nr:ribonuclease HII [Desulfobotulus pelophilus]MCW7754533.1 ribonuclease HII [Desulfobotulus pelophilus]
MVTFETLYRQKGYSCIAGVDEAGRGPLAGPVVSAAVVLKPDFVLPGLNDSKKLSESRRRKLYACIRNQSLGIGVGIVGPDRIDEINIHQASLESMVLAVKKLAFEPDFLLIDGKFTLLLPVDQQAVVGGDGKSASIAAASVIAKVTRDAMMEKLGQQYPGYGFEFHKGYPTPYHKEAIERLGVLSIHRRSFRGVKEFVS